jgi:hypothetical protein
MELYEKGVKLAEALTYIEVYAEGDYSDYDGAPLGIDDLFEHDLLCGKFEDLVKECLYLTYMGNEIPDRAEEMYATIIDIGSTQTKLEDVLQIGNQELPEFEAFLPLWIDCLGGKKERRAEELLIEAQSMVQDDSVLLENARRYAETHPSLYKQLLEMRTNSGEDGETLEIGLEALEKIPVSYTIRGEIAIQTAAYAVKSGKTDVAEQCWMEAFRSDSSVVNYMRIRFMSGDPKRYTEQIRKTIDNVFAKSNQEHIRYEYGMKQERENTIHTVEYCIMMFFEKQFDRMEETGMKADKALGWSSTFMKEGMALMLLLLFEGTILPEGLCAMRQRVLSAGKFSAQDFYRGTDRSNYKSDREEFQAIFDVWKATVVLPEAERKVWLDKIASWMSKRTQAIMENNRRNYYAECASYIAAIGEVRQSLGDANAKARIMEEYRQEYSRRRAFHAELRNFGMKK